MASTSSSHQQDAFSGIETPNKMWRIEESSRLHDVFINHRGADVKQILATKLYKSLGDVEIKTFLDSEEKELGDSFPSTIETVIFSAKVHIAIFSPRYAESAWCLAELVLMLQSQSKIVPVFYQVKPSDLRYIESGAYADAFLQYQKKVRHLEKLDTWKEALEQVSYTAGYEFKTIIDSGDCKDIVSAVEKEVNRKKPLPVAKYPVGLHKLVKEFERRCLHDLVQDFESQCGVKKAAKGRANVVGIFGMGGVGKTTLSLELFYQKISKYTRSSFLYDVREAYARGTLSLLQSQLVKDIFSEGNRSFPSNKEGTRYLRDLLERSGSLSFLIVLDDIDHVEQLDALLPMDILNKHGNNNHLVIITTRDVRVLVSAGIDIAYHLRGLDREDGRELFCLHAFNRPQPDEGYEVLVEGFAIMCGGLPLSLIVLSRHVSGRPQWYWQDELVKVRKALPGDVKKSLKISFDALDNEEKQIFMDIACFYIDMSFTKAMTIWEGSGWRPRHALQTLKEKCLVEEVELCHLNRVLEKWESSPNRSVLRMHDHLRDLGREMADEQTYPRRVWNPQHLQSLESKGFRNILTQTKGRCFHSFLDKFMGCEITYIIGEQEDNSESSLQWLQLEYQSQRLPDLNLDIESSLPSWIPLQKLQCLRISNGCFRKLWQSNVQVPSHLKELQIQSTFVEEFPDFLGKLDELKKLVLHAKDIQTDIWSLFEPLRMNVRSLKMKDKVLIGDLAYNDTEDRTNFNSLVIYDYKRLWEGEVVLNNEGTVMSKVEDLEIHGCRLVMKILINGNCCQRLQSLKLSEMKNLVQVDLSRIETLKTLEISGCEKFKRLSAMSDFSNLMELKISKCLEIEELPYLSCLEKNTIENCNYVKSLLGPSNLPKLAELNIIQCLGFEELSLTHLICLKKITIENCNYLKSVSGISKLEQLVELKISDCDVLEFAYLGFSGMKCLERVIVDGYVKMEHFDLDSCENLREIMFDFKNVVKLSIRYCAQLEKFPNLTGPSCLKRIIIDGCGNFKYLNLDGLKNLESVSGNLQLRRMNIIKCPVLEELPCLDKMCCLEQIKIDSCEKIQHIILPTSLIRLDVQSCRVLRRVAVAGELTKLTQLIIKKCPALEKLPNIAGMSNLKIIEIDCIEELQRITLPTGRVSLNITGCGDLQRKKGILIRTGHIELYITGSPKLDLRRLCSLSCLKEIVILSCEKLQNITLPTTLFKLDVRNCSDLQRIEGTSDLKRLVIAQCPALEELPSPSKLNCLEEIEIESSEKLQNITLPTATLTSLSVYGCTVLQGIAGIADLIKLTRLRIVDCPKLQELPLSRLNCLEETKVSSCEELGNIALPTTLVRLSVKGCRVLHRVAGLPDVTKLTQLCIAECPALQLPCLGRLICLEKIEIDSCKNLQNISAVEELHVPEYTTLSHCGYAVTRYFIDRWKSAPRCTCLIGKAVDGAESSLNESLFSEANIAVDGVTEISTDTDNVYRDWSGLGAVIVCFAVAIDSSTLAEDINETISIWSKHDFKMRQGESLVTVVKYSQYMEDERREWELLSILGKYRIVKKGFRVDLKVSEKWRSMRVLRTIVDRLYDKE